MKARTRSIGAVTGLVLALALSACSGAQEAPTPTAAAPSSSVSTEAPSAPAMETETVSYSLSDGSEVEIDPAAPLPEAVVADAKAQVNAEIAAFQGYPVDGELSTEQSVYATDAKATADDLASALSDVTGKQVIVVYGSYGSIDGVTYGTGWSVTAFKTTQVMSSMDKDTVIVDLNTWVAAQQDPGAYIVIAP